MALLYNTELEGIRTSIQNKDFQTALTQLDSLALQVNVYRATLVLNTDKWQDSSDELQHLRLHLESALGDYQSENQTDKLMLIIDRLKSTGYI